MSLIKKEDHGSIIQFTLDRSEVRNAMSMGLIEELGAKIRALKSALKPRVLIVTGAGDKAFSAGADLKERQGMNTAQVFTFVKTIQSTFQELAALSIPTIAALNGDAFGGGLELALACDLRIASSNALMGLTECSLGIVPGAGGTQRLPRIVGLSHAMDLIFSAQKISAAKAQSIGLVNYVAENANATRGMALELAEKIAKNAPLALKAAKAALLSPTDDVLQEGLKAELMAYQKILDTKDRLEGLKAFQEKRSPQFYGH